LGFKPTFYSQERNEWTNKMILNPLGNMVGFPYSAVRLEITSAAKEVVFANTFPKGRSYP
jgi:hypothetical protein